MGKEKQLVINKYNKIFDTRFTISDFENKLDIIIKLRNLALHHHPIVSYAYASIIKNCSRHTKKDGKSISLDKTIATLCEFINRHSVQKLVKEIEKVLNKYKFTTQETFDHVFKECSKLLNVKALKEVKRVDRHFSIINLIKREKKRILKWLAYFLLHIVSCKKNQKLYNLYIDTKNAGSAL